jgi:HD-GYP domain-containing protein (c-di-GMP phosphodiesterase class II)
MKQHAKRYALLVLLQGACLALGLWLEHRFVLFAEHPDATASALAANGPATGGAPQGAPQESDEKTIASRELSVAVIRTMAFVWIAALQAVVAYLVLTPAHEETRRKETRSAHVSLERYNDLLRTRDAVIFGLAKLAESRDADTGNHLERISLYSTRLASALRPNPHYRGQITPQFVELIGISSSLHDIGKVALADSILLKPGTLEKHERLMMQLHALIGGNCVKDIESRLGRSNFLQMAREIAFGHHERWDGTGYPRGLAGEEIPLAARIVAIADVYDALSTKRVYKEALPHRQCVQMIKDGAGTHFDPTIVSAFLQIEPEFHNIAREYAELSVACSTSSTSANGGLDFATTVDRTLDDGLATAMDLLDQCTGDPVVPSGLCHPDTDAPASFSGRPQQVPKIASPEQSSLNSTTELEHAS